MPEDNEALEPAPASANDGVEEPTVEQTPATPYDELKSFMEARDLKSPDDFTGYVEGLGETEQWKNRYGNSQNEVGELRRKLEAMEAQIQQNQSYQGYEEQPVNIKSIVGQEVRNALGEVMTQQQQAQMKYLVERNDLMKRPGWKDVQPHFDTAMSDPQIQFALQSGKLTQDRLYSQINERVLMSKVNSFVNTIPQGTLSTPAPNMETSDRTKQPIPEPAARQQRIQKAQENQDVDALLREIIPDDDPIVRY